MTIPLPPIRTPGKWLTGDKLTYVEFFAYEMLDHARILLGEDILGKELRQVYNSLFFAGCKRCHFL